MWFTPILGATSTELCFIQLFTKTRVLICALSCKSLQVLKLCTKLQSLRTQLQIFFITQKPSAHTTAEVIHTHSWDLTFLTKIALASHQFILHQKPNLTYLQECVFI